MRGRFLIAVTFLIVSVAASGQEIVVPLHEVGIDGGDVVGERSICTLTPDPQVKAYPPLKADKPVYGTVAFGKHMLSQRTGTVYHFVIDATDGKNYDRLVLDLNRDLDLTNDTPVPLMTNPPQGLLSDRKEVVFRVFEKTAIQLVEAEGTERTAQVIPRVIEWNDEAHASIQFLPTTARTGEFAVGGKGYKVTLVNGYSITGRYDLPQTECRIKPKDPQEQMPYWWGHDALAAMHWLGGTLYAFSATPEGERLTAQPYNGDWGAFRAGTFWNPGTMTGSLRSKDRFFRLSGPDNVSDTRAESACAVPVGLYTLEYLTVNHAGLKLFLSENYHADGAPRQRECLSRYGIEIRKGKTFTLDFSKRPEILFAAPGKGGRVKMGDSLDVKAVLIDPKLDIMYREIEPAQFECNSWGIPRHMLLQWTPRCAAVAVALLLVVGLPWALRPAIRKRHRFLPITLLALCPLFAAIWVLLETRSAGAAGSYTPTVFISRANGEKVAEGTMPFG